MSFALAVAQGLLQLAPSLEVNGLAITLTKSFASPTISLLIAFAISRFRSRIAAVIFLAALGLSLWLVYLDLVEGYWNNWPFAVGLLSIAFDLAAGALIVRWFARSEF